MRQSQEEARMSMIANAMGDRRYRDLSDIVFQLEGEVGWQQTLTYLQIASNKDYSIPVGTGAREVTIEPLKYREGIFNLFSCQALEPIPVATTTIIEMAAESSSYVQSVRSVSDFASDMALTQIESGDTLFYSPDELTAFGNPALESLLHNRNLEAIKTAVIQERSDGYHIGQLWNTGLGMRALLEVDLAGLTTDYTHLNTVLSVIQAWTGTLVNVMKDEATEPVDQTHPTSSVYRALHQGIINQDIDVLKSLGSRHSIPTANSILSSSIKQYLESESSSNYRMLLEAINLHVRIRSIESILLLEDLTTNAPKRVTTAAIVALANFYHESAVSALAILLCKTQNDEVVQSTSKALINIAKRLPEIVPTLKSVLNQDCSSPSRINQLLRKITTSQDRYQL